jgi:flagellar protein FlbT
MPLKIDLKPGEKFVLNGAVVSVGRDGRSLLLQNEAVLLREKDVMQEDEANTPARRIYFTIMLMYIDPANKPHYMEKYQTLLNDFAKVAILPEMQKILSQIAQDVAEDNYYRALRNCKSLFEIEHQLLQHGNQPA